MKHTLIPLALTAFSCVPASAQLTEPAKPFGVQIGVTTCQEAMAPLYSTTPRLERGVTVVRSDRPGDLYAGATDVLVRCVNRDAPVLEMEVWMRRSIQPAGALMTAYRGLEKKYMRVRGGPPADGRVSAVFMAQDRVAVELSAPPGIDLYAIVYRFGAVPKKSDADKL